MIKKRKTLRVSLICGLITLAAAIGGFGAGPPNAVSLVIGTKIKYLTMPMAWDGKYKDVLIAGRKARVNTVATDKKSLYLYFRTPDYFTKTTGDVYVTIEFFDSQRQEFGFQYDNGESPYAEGPQTFTTGAKEWVRGTFKLPNARLARRQNANSDFRIAAMAGLYISSIEISRAPRKLGQWPSARERLAKAGLNGRRPSGMEYTFGNDATDDQAMLFRSLGVTSVETYVTWETVESKAKGEWDWSKWDAQADVLKRNDLKWVPFLILGPAYSTPDWFRASSEHVGCACLEHDTASKIESLWNPYLPAYIDRFLGEFAKRYRDTGVLESLLLGIQGDFGEAIYSVFGGGWTFKIPGEYHNHTGFWCGDEYALKSFREWAVGKYGSLDGVNTAWGTNWGPDNAIDFPARGEAALKDLQKALPTAPTTTKRRWLDFVDWYRGEMTRFSDWWIETTKKHFPKTPIYLCTGGHAPPEHGANFAEQCKVAAKHGAGVRITNEASIYADNFVITRWVGGAGKLYGAFYGFEPAGGENEKGIVARIYNATASGANQLHDYNNNVTSSPSRMDAQQAHLKYLKKSEPIVDVALWYPNVAMSLKWGDYLQRAAAFRDVVDYDYVDESMLRDGALGHYKILVMIYGDVAERSDLELIERWVRDGGMVIATDVNIKTVEGDSEPFSRLFDAAGEIRLVGKGRTLLLPDKPKEEFNKALSEMMIDAGIPNADGVPDGVYATLLKGNTVLFLNTTAADVEKTIVMPDGRLQKAVAKAETITEVGL